MRKDRDRISDRDQIPNRKVDSRKLVKRSMSSGIIAGSLGVVEETDVISSDMLELTEKNLIDAKERTAKRPRQWTPGMGLWSDTDE